MTSRNGRLGVRVTDTVVVRSASSPGTATVTVSLGGTRRR